MGWSSISRSFSVGAERTAVVASPAFGVWITVIDATIAVVMSPVKPPDYESGLSLSAVDRTGSTNLHEQVAGEIRRAIADGEAKPGERIPC